MNYDLSVLTRRTLPLAVVLLLFLIPFGVKAHGSGTLVQQVTVEPYQLSVWVDPDPLIIGEAHITVGVGRAEDGAAITNAIVEVTLTDPSGNVSGSLATTEKSVNKFLYEADTIITQLGVHDVVVTVNSLAGKAQTDFSLTATEKSNRTPIIIGIVCALVAIYVAMRVIKKEQ